MKPLFQSSAAAHDEASSSVALIRLAQSGDADAREELCARYLPRLRRFAHGRLPEWARGHLDTEDIVQDTLLHSVRRLDGFTPNHPNAFSAYVWEALRNRLRDAVRRAVRRPPGEAIDDSEKSRTPSPLELAVGAETLRRYHGALQRLSDVDRELIVGRVELGLDYEELAALFGKPSLNATRVAVSRALLRLATEMSGDQQR